MMKNKKFLIYTFSCLTPVLIFLICTFLNDYLPFKEEMLNSYDSFTQYPGFLLEFARNLKSGNLFYSWGAGLGFNLFGTITYYCMSPLNLFSLLATPENYPFFITAMTFLRFALLGFTMCFYLEHKKIKPIYIVLFSTIYALIGYTSTYYYNYIWIDSVIMLPLIIHGLDKLIEGKNPAFYFFTLTFTIMINYYIGYMICIFSVLWFIHKLPKIQNKRATIKRFLLYSLLSGLSASVVILPSIFALLTGKASIYSSVDYSGFTRNAINFFYTLLPGSYQQSDQILGPGLIYSSILVLVLTVFYFFNTKYTKKEKIITLIILLFFYFSLSIRFLNYAWQLFQKPIWWQSRFSFVISFFLITLATDTLMNIKHTKLKLKHRIFLLIGLIVLIFIGAIFKWSTAKSIQSYTYFFFGFSILLLIEIFFLLDKKDFIKMIIIFTLIEISLNTFNSLKQNYRYKSYTHFSYIKEELPLSLNHLNDENSNFYRFEFIDDFTSNDGLYFGFNGINYFNSVRNIKVVNLMEQLGLKVTDQCHFILTDFDPVLLSILNIKYLYGTSKEDYYKNIDKLILEHPFPLSLGFAVDRNITSFDFPSNLPFENREALLQALSGLKHSIYSTISNENFTESLNNNKHILTYEFKSDGHYLLIPEDFGGRIKVNDDEQIFSSTYREVFKNDKVVFQYSIDGSFNREDIKLTLLNLDNYEEHMKVLNENLLHAKTNTNGHILDAKINITTHHDYLFTSIEYEEGMTVYVDGEKVKPDIILDTLIGLQLSKGEHTIIIDYIPKGFILGLIISCSSLLFTITILIYQKRIISF